MQAILKPISHPELGELVINDSLFCVGRDGEAFAGLPNIHTGRLSRRHARLFEQDGVIYIVDLGSRNGTFVNGEPLAMQPKTLQSGDLIDFAGELTYRLDVLANDGPRKAARPSAPSTLHLQAAAQDDGPDSLVVTAFPFLVSKQADAFARYQQRAPAEVEYLSRRHAHIFRHDGRLFIEDLGSTNGTFVNGRRLGDESVELLDGQTVAFGGDYFVYRVVLEAEDTGTRVLAAPPTGQTHPDVSDKTTFVTAATSFLDIFCGDDAEPDTPDDPVPQAAAHTGAGVAGRRAGLLRRWGLTVAGRERAVSLRAKLVSVLVAASVLAGGYWLLQPSPTDRMQSLIEQERFDETLALARGGDTGGDGGLMSRLALRALITKTLPGWLDALDAARFDQMKAIIDDGRMHVEPLTAAGEYLDLLAIIGEIQATITKRGGPEIPLRLFDEETTGLADLVEAWESPRPDKRQVTERLFAALPPAQAELTGRYEAAYRRAASQIRTLESKLAVYRPAQQQIAGLLRTHLAQGTLDRLDVELDRVAARYGQLTGFDRLHQDLTRYRAILEALKQDRETEAAQLAANARFHAPPFAEAAARLAQERLPSDSFLEGYAAALDLWLAGRIDAARDRLTPLLETPWKAIAQREIDRMGRVAEGFADVQAARGSDVDEDRLLDFFHGLDGDRDLYFLQSLREDYLQSREQTTRRAEQAASAAEVAWSSYQDQGGINSTHRLDSHIGKAYIERAGALSTAAAAADRASRAYARAKTAIPEEQRLLLVAIAHELALQHQSLDKLQGVLNDVALRQKRALLPPIASGKVQDEKFSEPK